MTNNLHNLLTSEQAARALQAKRRDRKRELLDELAEVNNELVIIDRYIQRCYNDKQADMFD